MNARQFAAQPAVRERVPLLIGLAGPSGSGKTKSALRIADGIRSVTGGEVYVIDTEARRALHYAGEHKFQHVPFDAPFGSRDYLQAIRFCVEKGAKVVIVDSMSHEHEGPGGLIDYQESELDRLAGNDWAKRERMKMLAWQRPKAARRELINGLLQLNCNFVFCFRAREKTKPIKKDGKTEIVEMGWMPIAGDELVYEMTACCLLLPKSGGVPTWQSEHIGEKAIMKLPGYLAGIFKPNTVLTEDTGRELATWARGESLPPKGDGAQAAGRAAPVAGEAGAATTTTGSPRDQRTSGEATVAPADTGPAGATTSTKPPTLLEEARMSADRGQDVFNAFYRRITPDEKRAISVIGEELRSRLNAAKEKEEAHE